VLEPKIKVIINGINLEREKLVDLDNKSENKIKNILFVGAIKERKGVLEAIEACRYYRDNISDNFIYNLVGSYNQEESYYQKVFRKIKEYHLEDKIVFQGRVVGRDLQNYYSNADLFMMPSLNIDNNFEGFGLVFLEANVKGVPTIGSKDSGCQEAIVDGKTGYVVDPYNPEEIAQKMDLILNKAAINPLDCVNWAKRNDIKIKAKELVDFYENIIHSA
jgi:glycosyltransferase involved in cell wall biosynthesis